MPNAWKILADHPPCLVRLLARRKVKGKQVRAISSQEVAITSGLKLPRVHAISQMTSWDEVAVAEAERFVAGCGFDPLKAADRNRKSAYQRSCKTQNSQMFTYLRSSPLWQSEFVPLIRLLQSRRSS